MENCNELTGAIRIKFKQFINSEIGVGKPHRTFFFPIILLIFYKSMVRKMIKSALGVKYLNFSLELIVKSVFEHKKIGLLPSPLLQV